MRFVHGRFLAVLQGDGADGAALSASIEPGAPRLSIDEVRRRPYHGLKRLPAATMGSRVKQRICTL